ncbi:MAG: YfhO family protein [Christensenellaceae bacterium]
MNFFGVFSFPFSPFSFLVAFVDADISFRQHPIMLKMCAISSRPPFLFPKIPRPRSAERSFVRVVRLFGLHHDVLPKYYLLDMVYVFRFCFFLWTCSRRKRLFFVCALAACLFINYISYMIVVFLLYAFLWLIISKDKGREFFPSLRVGRIALRRRLAAFFVQYFSSGRKSSVIRNLQNSGLVTPYQTAFPTVFSTLFLFPFTLSRKVSKDGKLRFILFLLTLVPLLIEPVNKMWQTGSYMSFPTRYAFMTIFLCLTLAMDCMTQPSAPSAVKEQENDENTKKNVFFFGGRAPAVICSVLLGALALGYFLFSVNYTKENVTVMDQYSNTLWGNDASFEALLKLYLLAFGVGALCFALYKLGLLKPVGLWVCVGLLVVSELYVAPQTYMLSPAHETTGYRQIVDLADRIEDDGFYRVKTERNIPLWISTST